jgi:hypothetical protein
MEKIKLKGGSLSGTYLINPGSGPSIVRKEVSLIHNREYGFQRWYSQLKRMQRYSIIFPGIFPEIINYGRDREIAFFDMPYLARSQTVQEFLLNTDDKIKIDRMFHALVDVMNLLHNTEIVSFHEPLDLYIYEEIEQKLKDCRKNDNFIQFLKYDHLYFNDHRVPTFISQLEKYSKMARESYQYTTETFTHGNLTLENILYQPEENRIIFIDPYEENIIDSVLAEYSQIYQSSNSKYEIYNEQDALVEGNQVTSQLSETLGLDYFNEIFTNFVKSKHDEDAFRIIKLLEISQFIRMLPFKMTVDESKMVLFYSLASYLFYKLDMGE